MQSQKQSGLVWMMLIAWAFQECIMKGGFCAFSIFDKVHLYVFCCSPIQIIRQVHLQKLKIFRWKTLIFFLHISAQNIDCGYSLEPPRLEQKWENNIYPCKPQFYYIKVGLRGSKLYGHVFVMCNSWTSLNVELLFPNIKLLTDCPRSW